LWIEAAADRQGALDLGTHSSKAAFASAALASGGLALGPTSIVTSETLPLNRLCRDDPQRALGVRRPAAPGAAAEAARILDLLDKSGPARNLTIPPPGDWAAARE
jgi:hypothetical protein